MGEGVIPEGRSLTSKDASLRSQELADLSRGPAGVGTPLHPVGQVKQRHVGSQGEGSLQRQDHGAGLSTGKACGFLIALK